MAKYIDADQLIAEIDRQINSLEKDWLGARAARWAFEEILKHLDTLPEQEHPIYELNQILLDWVREAKTDKEQEARFEAYKRFFELYDENMEQEPEQSVDGLEEAAERWCKENGRGFVLRDKAAYYIGETLPAFKAGAEWQKDKMMEEAVEGVVMDFSSNLPRPQVDIRLDPGKYHTGDKVKMIVIKEDKR